MCGSQEGLLGFDSRSMGEHVLLTGGQGFFGAWIIKELLAKGAQVTVTDLREANGILEQVLLPEELASLKRVYMDIGDTKALTDFILSTRPTGVIHLAGLQIPLVKANPAVGANVNVTGTVNIFQAVLALAQKEEKSPIPVVYASSAAVLGPEEAYATKPVPAESVVHTPATLYGVYKLANEGTGRIFWQDHKVPSAGLRPLTAYGVGRELGLTSGPAKAIKSTVMKRQYTCPVKGITGFVYVRDVARMFIGCLEASRKSPGARVFNVRGHVLTVEDFLTKHLEVELPTAKELVKLALDAAAVPIAADVDESPLAEFLGKMDTSNGLHTPIRTAIREMATCYEALQAKGKLSAHDLEPPAPPPAKKQKV